MNDAAARAARRRGSSITSLAPPSHGSAMSASGTRVVLPAPGGASSTATVRAASAARSDGMISSIGSVVVCRTAAG